MPLQSLPLLLLILACSHDALGGTITVNSPADIIKADAIITLREAMLIARGDRAVYINTDDPRLPDGDEKPIGLGFVKLSGEFGEDLDWEGTVKNKGGTSIVIQARTGAGDSWHLYE